MNRSLRLAQSEFSLASSRLSNFGNSSESLRLRINHLNRQVEIQRDLVDTLNRRYQESVRATGENSRATENLRIRLNNATAQLNNMQRELNVTSSRWTQVSQVMGRTGESFKAVGEKMSAVGSRLSTMVTLPIIGIGAAATKSAMDFEQGMANVKAVSNATGREMKSLKDLALKMGMETKYSATEAAKGIEELAKAGLTTKQILDGGLKGALSLATAGELELGEAAEIASTALNAFKADTLSVKDAADILAGAANSSATSVSEMRYGLAAVSAVSSSVGMSFKDTATALAVFAQNGLKSSDAGTSLKTMLMNLQPSTKEQKEEFEKLGLVTENGASKFYDAAGKLKSMAEVAGILKAAMAGMNDAQRQASMRIMFGTDAIRAANIMYKEGADGINQMQKAMAKIGADEVAAQKMNTLKGKIEEMKGSLETLGIQIGNMLIPIINKVIMGLTKWTNAFMGLSEPVKKAILVMAGIAAAIGPLFLIIGNFITIIGSLLTVISTISGAIASAGGITAALGAAFAAIISPVGITIAVIAALVAAVVGLIAMFVALYKNNTEFRDNVNVAWQQIKTAISRVIESLKVLIYEFVVVAKKWWQEYGDDVVRIATQAFNLVAVYVNSALKVLKDIINVATSLIKGDWQGAWEGIKTWAADWAQGLNIIIQGYLNLLNDIFKLAFEGIKTVIQQSWQTAQLITAAAWTAIMNVLNNALNAIKNVVINIWNGILGTTTNVWNSIKSAITNPINAAVNFVGDQINRIRNFFASLRISLPAIKLPHFSIKGKFSLSPPSVPSFGVNWYASGGIFNRPSIIGVGEAGAEAVIPIDKLEGIIRKAMQKNKGGEGISLNIQNFINNTERDIERLMYEIDFYQQRIANGRGSF